MLVFDADAHVMEGAQVFADKYWGPKLRDRRPTTIAMNNRPYWVIDGQIFPRWRGPGAHILGSPTRHDGSVVSRTTVTNESLESLEVSDPAARLADMDREEIDIQVLYPSLFLAPLTEDPELAMAMARSYNRWLSDVCAGQERLKWVAYTPLFDVRAAVAEVRAARHLGAIGLIIYGTVGDKMLDRKEFLPFFEAAAAEDLPVGVHVGWSWPALTNAFDNIYLAGSIGFTIPVLLAFTTIVGGGVLDKVPALRVGFFEAGCMWIHFLMDRLEMRFPRAKRLADEIVGAKPPPAKYPPMEYIKSGRLYFNCEAEDKLLPDVIDLVGEDYVVWASDMPHASREHFAARSFMERQDLTDTQKRKILWDNGFRFYGLPVPAGAPVRAGR